MKKFFAIFFLVSFAAVNFQQASLTVLYVFNKDFITEAFCINKEKPALKCNGKCHLKDQISKATSEKEDNKNTSQTQIMVAVFISDVNFWTPELVQKSSLHSDRPFNLKNNHVYNFLDPPKFT